MIYTRSKVKVLLLPRSAFRSKTTTSLRFSLHSRILVLFCFFSRSFRGLFIRLKINFSWSNFNNSSYLFLPASHCNLDVLRRLILSRCCRRHCWRLMISRHNIRFREKSLVKKLRERKKRGRKKDKFLLFSISIQKWQLKRHYNTHIYTLRRFYSTIFSLCIILKTAVF